MSDENLAGGGVPPVAPQSPGAFDWLRESHQQSVPLAPLSEDIPSPAPAPSADLLQRQAPPSGIPAFADLVAAWTPEPDTRTAEAPAVQIAPPVATPAPDAPAAQEPPVPSVPVPVPASSDIPLIPRPSFMSRVAEQTPPAESTPQPTAVQPPTVAPSTVAPPTVQQPIAQPSAPVATAAPTAATTPSAAVAPLASLATVSAPEDPLAFSFPDMTSGAEDSQPIALAPSVFGGGGVPFERHQSPRRSANGPLDIVALVLSIVAAPLGLILGIVAVIVDSKTKGFVTGIAKAAITIGIVLTIVLGIGGGILLKVTGDQAAHDAIIASSAAWCSKLQANPSTLASDTLDWPPPGDTIPDSVTAMQAYVTFWNGVVKVAPAGIKAGTAQIAAAAKSIASSVNSTQTLDDAADIAQMQSAAANSGVQSWATEYCK